MKSTVVDEACLPSNQCTVPENIKLLQALTMFIDTGVYNFISDWHKGDYLPNKQYISGDRGEIRNVAAKCKLFVTVT